MCLSILKQAVNQFIYVMYQYHYELLPLVRHWLRSLSWLRASEVRAREPIGQSSGMHPRIRGSADIYMGLVQNKGGGIPPQPLLLYQHCSYDYYDYYRRALLHRRLAQGEVARYNRVMTLGGYPPSIDGTLFNYFNCVLTNTIFHLTDLHTIPLLLYY